MILDFLTWVLTFAVAGYATMLTVKTGAPLLRYRKARDRVIKVDGLLSSFYGEEVTKRKKEIITSFYPIYDCVIEGKKISLNGVVRYMGKGSEAVGQKTVLLYDKETGEVWCEKDLPLMKKQIKVRVITVLALLILMIVTSIML